MYKLDREELLKQAKMTMKKTFLTAAVATTALSFNGCGTTGTNEAQIEIEKEDENLNKDFIGKTYSDVYNEGYKEGYIAATENRLHIAANELAHKENRLYVEVVSKNGNVYIAPLDELKCTLEKTVNKNNYYLEVTSNPGINLLDDTHISNDYTAEVITIDAETYLNNVFSNVIEKQKEQFLESHEKGEFQHGCIEFKYDSFEQAIGYSHNSNYVDGFKAGQEAREKIQEFVEQSDSKRL